MPHDPAFLLAEKKIEEARRLGAQDLDLSTEWFSEDAGEGSALNEFSTVIDSVNIERGVEFARRECHPARTPRPAQSQRPWLRWLSPRAEQTQRVSLGP